MSVDTVFSAAPGTLISVPQLLDPHFERSVVLMLLHNDEGALGLVLNHPTDHSCTEVMDELGFSWPGPPDAHLLRGGPVDPEGFWMLHRDADIEDSLVTDDGLVTSRTHEALEALLDSFPEKLLVGVGCAGWGPGQLEAEFQDGAWIHGAVTDELIFEWPRDTLWDRSLRALGIDPALLVTGGGVQ